MKFYFLPLSVFWHSMVFSNFSKRCFIVIFNSHAFRPQILSLNMREIPKISQNVIGFRQNCEHIYVCMQLQVLPKAYI